MTVPNACVRVRRAYTPGAPVRWSRRTWVYALLVLVLTASCSARPGPERVSDSPRTTVPGHARPSPTASARPSRTRVTVRVAARFRLPIASSGPAIVIGDDLWIALIRKPLKRIRATSNNPGHLVDVDTRTAHVKRVLDIGSFPSGIIASGHHIWVATTPGDIRPPAREPNLVVELDRHGSIVHRYRVHDPETITAAKDGVWVTTVTGRDGTGLQHLHDGRADPAIPLQSVASGRAALAECPDGLYAGDAATVTRFSRTGTNPRVIPLGSAGEAALTCVNGGVLAITGDAIVRITAQGKSAQTTRPPGPAHVATTPAYVWLLSAPTEHHRSTLTAVDPRTAALAPPRSIPAATDITADGTDLWTISAEGWVSKIETR